MLSKSKILVFVICVVLFIIPFIWLKPGELELGGDSNRLFLYNPGAYLQFTGLYSIDPLGLGRVSPGQNLLPFLLLLHLLNNIFRSPYILVCLLNSVKLVGSFLFIYLIIVEILKKYDREDKSHFIDIAGILAGLFYLLSPSVGVNMHAALITHNQVFLNPLIFYLMLRFLISRQSKYLWLTLLTTFIFSPNFTLMAPSPLFAFYPLAFLFIALYITVVSKKSLPWKSLLFGFILFLGMHSFHIIPSIAFIFDPGSDMNVRAFGTGTVRNEGLDYFNATLGLGKVINNIFYTYPTAQLQWTTLAAPLVLVLGFLLCKRKQTDYFLIATFFFVTVFLTSANITHLGVEFYRKLFYIPGFSMFRVFYGQWQWVHTFFYSLLFGFSLFIVLLRLKRKYVYITSVIIVGLFLFNGWTFVSGQVFKIINWGSNNMTSVIKIDPNYEKALGFLGKLPDDGKIFNFPFTDFGYQVIPGINNGAYIGVSPTAYLYGKNDFSGYSNIAPFSETFLKLAKEKNYLAIKRLFGILNVKYIFYIASPKAYQQYFPSFPYSLFLKAVPDSQSLNEFVRNVTDEQIFKSGDYFVYKTDIKSYLPHFYVPTQLFLYDDNTNGQEGNASFFVNKGSIDPKVGYIEKKTYSRISAVVDYEKDTPLTKDDIPEIIYERINPTKYKIEVSHATKPFVLVFLDQFHKDWKLYVLNKDPERLARQESYFNGSILESIHSDVFLDKKTFETLGMKSIPEGQHFMVNGYANAWLITQADTFGRDHFEVIVEMTQQRVFYYGLGISLMSLFIFSFYGIKLLKR